MLLFNCNAEILKLYSVSVFFFKIIPGNNIVQRFEFNRLKNLNWVFVNQKYPYIDGGRGGGPNPCEPPFIILLSGWKVDLFAFTFTIFFFFFPRLNTFFVDIFLCFLIHVCVCFFFCFQNVSYVFKWNLEFRGCFVIFCSSCAHRSGKLDFSFEIWIITFPRPIQRFDRRAYKIKWCPSFFSPLFPLTLETPPRLSRSIIFHFFFYTKKTFASIYSYLWHFFFFYIYYTEKYFFNHFCYIAEISERIYLQSPPVWLFFRPPYILLSWRGWFPWTLHFYSIKAEEYRKIYDAAFYLVSNLLHRLMDHNFEGFGFWANGALILFHR